MTNIVNYAVDENKNIIYALVEIFPSNNQAEFWVAKSAPIKEPVNLSDLENNWVWVTKLEGPLLLASKSTMQIKNSILYILDRSNHVLLAINIADTDNIKSYPLPTDVDGTNLDFEDQMLYIQSDKGKHKIYIGGKGEVLLFNDDTQKWDIFFKLPKNEDPFLINGNEDIMIVVPNTYKNIYVALTGTSNFIDLSILDDKHSIPYKVVFNGYADIFTFIHLEGNVNTFKYKKFNTSSIQIAKLDSLVIDGFKIQVYNGTPAGSTTIGGTTQIGVINQDNAPTLKYNSASVNAKGKISAGIKDKSITIEEEPYISSVPIFTLYVGGVSLYLDYYGNFIASNDQGKNWTSLNINIPLPN